jgi:hypothetical protein
MWWHSERRSTRRRFLLVGTLVAALGTAACTSSVAGAPSGVEIGPLTVESATTQALRTFAEAGSVLYKGSLSSADGAAITVDVGATVTGEVYGSITVEGLAASIVVIDRTLFLRAAPDFWAALAARFGVSSGDGTALGNRWVKLPSSLLGVEFADIFTPDLVVQAAGKVSEGNDKQLAEASTEDVGGVETIPVKVDGGTVRLSKTAPHSVLQFQLDSVGSADNTSASDVTVTVADQSPQLVQIYANLVNQTRTELVTAVDALVSVTQGAHRFEGCAAASCTLVVDITNPGKAPVRVHLKADWTGDNAPLGSCEATVGPVAPGATSPMSCAIASPEWESFFRRANSVPGSHPYGAQWAALVLADLPDVTPLEAEAAATAPTPAQREGEGSHAVYEISSGGQAWKFGVAAHRFWREQATDQLTTCVAIAQAVCTYSLVSAAGSPAAAFTLLNQLVTEAKEENDGGCPPGQWVSCTP